MNPLATLSCIKCGQIFPLAAAPLTCPNHNPYYGYLSVHYQYDAVYGFVDGTKHSWEAYTPLLPVASLFVHFNETKTPLIKAIKFGSVYGLSHLWIKDEGKNPTGSFKDKESIVAINAAKEFGLNNVLVVSSGNAAVSTAGYAQKAGMPCTCRVPKNLSVGKRFLLNLYGAQMEFREGSYEDLYREAVNHPTDAWNVTPGYNPYKEEGIKIIGFEIWEDIGVPDIIVTPCGNGTLLWSLYKAFKELTLIGKTDKIPQFIGVQVAGGAPLAKAYAKGTDYEVVEHPPDSMAEGIIASESYASPKVMIALQSSGGTIITVTEEEIHQALKSIVTTESLIPDPTSAAVYAGLVKLAPTDRTIVAIQTAAGMKNLKEIMESYLNGPSKRHPL